MNITLTPEEIAEYERRSARLPDDITDPIWRIANLYSVLKEGKDVPFVPTPEQRIVIVCIFIRGWLRIVIPKARQLGMSTLLAIIAADGIQFRSGFSAALIDKTSEDAKKKHKEKVIYVIERLPAFLREQFKYRQLTDSLTIEMVSNPEAPSSQFEATINFRGGTVQMLWVSEWGTIQNDDRQRSKEIKAGAMPAVEKAENGLCVIETTWKGGLDGEVGPYVNEALDTPEEQKGPKSWRIIFFPWWTCKEYVRSYGYIDPTSAQYFRECEKKGLFLTREQKLWYAEKRRTASSEKSMKEEYPSFVEECWENLPEGSIYGKWISEAHATGRIVNFSPPRDYPVHTFWDIGHPLNTVCWLAQFTPYQVRVVDVLMEVDMTPQQRASWLRDLQWDYGYHFFPPDADSDGASIGFKPITLFRQVFGASCRVLPAYRSIWDPINALRAHFSRLVFRADMNDKKDRVKQGIEFLGRYRAEREASTGIAKDVPIHDRYSHGASALGMMGLVLDAGMVAHANSVGGRGNVAPPPLKVITAGANY